MITLTLPDKSQKTFPEGTTPLDVAKSIGAGLAKASLAGKLDGQWIDLRAPMNKSGAFEIITEKHPQAGEVIRHSAEHVLAQAVKKLWPKTQVDVGRTDHSEKFQYDFKVEKAFTPDDLIKIEEEMKKLIAQNAEFTREVLPRQDAIELFTKMGEELKVLRINDIPSDQDISLFRHGDFVDLCRGPHVQNTKQIGAIKILEASASYFKGDEKNMALQRIYGTAFTSEKALKEYETLKEEALKRDHRKIGKELDLFSVNEDVGPGLILWHPKGAMIRNIIENYWREMHLQGGYDLVYSPHVARRSMWDKSGHTSFYSENMFAPMEVEEQNYQLKPMNCPFHIQIYKSHLRSYRDLPLRYAELGTVYRFERSGVLHGLMRVRGFTQDDAHLFITPAQLPEEITKVLNFVVGIFRTFGFHEYQIYLSTRPEKSVGSDENWTIGTQALENALKAMDLPYEVDPGEGVFYGPKIDIKVKDSIGRMWQCATIQADFNLPERFDLEFVDVDGTRKRPIMLHRALLGSVERFFGVLVEHHAGVFPFWLSPVQAKIIPITDGQMDYAREVANQLKTAGFRVEIDERSEKLGYKIREAQLQKVPYMIVLGDQEKQKGEVSIRKRTGEQVPNSSVGALIETWKQEERDRK
ncbi:MAG: threonine--tRNA ligase [Proteobacteria bacterium]|jgi:threonyl-tRNA synthetase|nr:threonine--tRNA ligase [Pseudomonadota bacterium]